MSRIRSIHPGQWTDEDFVECSAFARLLAIGLRNEADDNGVFEWKPTSLKMKLLPADNVDVAALLDELSEKRQVASYEHSGKRYGVIRNFRRWQRPERPKSWHPVTDDMRIYAGVVADQSPTDNHVKGGGSTTNRRQIDDQSVNCPAEEGGRRKDVGGKAAQHYPPSSLPREAIDPGPIPPELRREPSRREPGPAEPARAALRPENQPESPENRLISAFDAACRTAWPEAHRAYPAATDGVVASRLAEAGADEKLVADVADSVLRRRAAKGKTCPSALGFIEGAVLDALADRKAGKPAPSNGIDTGGYTGPTLTPELREMFAKTDPEYLADLDRRQGRAP